MEILSMFICSQTVFFFTFMPVLNLRMLIIYKIGLSHTDVEV